MRVLNSLKKLPALLGIIALTFGLAACSPAPPDPVEREAPAVEQETAAELPARFQRPAYALRTQDARRQLDVGDEPEVRVPVGADISSTVGPVPLREILRKLANLKGMNISWASDVDQHVPVDVDIRAEDDFYQAINNLLRQVDYFHEMERNTIVVRYQETRAFHVAMPFMRSTYSTGVGGDVLGAGGIGGGSGALVGNIQLTSDGNEFDIWDNIRQNLDQLLEIWDETVQTSPAPGTNGEVTTTRRRDVKGGKGYYAIDKPIGLITVTAPRPLVNKIEEYLDNLKSRLFRQISIEAKIVEVNLDEQHKSGIDWRGVLSGKHLNFELFGPQGIIYPWDAAGGGVTQATIGPNPFQILLDAIESQGSADVLANPKISVMNGQPAMITVGETFRYISQVETTTDTGGGVSTSVTTDTVMSGLGLAVLPTITDEDEIVLSLTPVTSSLTQPMQERSFQGMIVQLPQINIRELNSVVKIRNGDTLMIGGLIDNVQDTTSNQVPILGNIPILGKLFSHETKTSRKRELVILLQPTII
ncbi:type II and III secretion system protein [Desulfurivibrio dismutans]|uniref:type II and III secretion system protein n=1 Tax=Desulfurivibrio dismutans TaxID=1398908 RepID=UPI0023DA219E|nr:type II and III secretion system protein [Desulfurivibrio alkaliphilus]MDF1615723.1 hypothetical protein [Desulfurivibrio alkaliphilus]